MNKVAIKTTDLKKLMKSVCKKHRISSFECKPIVQNYLEAELLGKRTHGVAKFCFESRFFSDRVGKPLVVADTGPLLKLDGNKEVGPLAADYCVSLCVERAKKYGVCILGLNNIQRYGILSTWVKRFAENHLFGLVMNTCEPAMTGYQGKKRVLGTNPIAFAIPTEEKTYIVDMATSKVAMSLIWQALEEQKPLPNNTFYDEKGEVTINPKQAKAVQHFGGIKGFSIALLVQLLTGSIFNFKMASRIRCMYDIGYIFFAIDPAKVTKIDSMLKSNQSLLDELSESGSLIPGSRSANLKRSNKILINKNVLEELQNLGGTT